MCVSHQGILLSNNFEVNSLRLTQSNASFLYLGTAIYVSLMTGLFTKHISPKQDLKKFKIFKVRVKSCFVYCVLCQHSRVCHPHHRSTRDCVHYCRIYIRPSNTSLQCISIEWNAKKILLNTIMTAAYMCCLWKIIDAIAWTWGRGSSNWRENGHGEWRLLVSFDGGYCTGYHCLREIVAWPALKVGNGQCKAQYGRNCKSGQKAWTILY